MNKEIFKRIFSSLILIPLALFFVIKGSYYFVFFLFVVWFLASMEWYVIAKKESVREYGLIFLMLSFISAFLLRGSTNAELWNLLLILLICVSTDIGGYVFGKILKGPKLTKISPNKTLSGMVGSFLLSIIFSSIYLDYLYSLKLSNNIFSITDLIFVLIVSLVSQVGDVVISFFKRKSKVKNTGKLIPGHGGLLDRIDGIIFAIPTVHFLKNYLGFF